MAKQDRVKSAISEIVGGKPQADQPKGDYSGLDAGKIQATGVGLREGELAALEAIGEELGEHLGSDPIARNALMRIAIRRFVVDYLQGKITLAELASYFEIPEKPKPRLDF